jgi:acetyl-CoA carboxylase biotin carboxyl carrier protein
MIDENEIRSLAALMEQTGLTALEIDRKNDMMRLERGASVIAAPMAVPASGMPAVASSAPVATAAGEAVCAPMVGVFYAAPAPGAQPYVSIGDRVEVGQVLCVVEAMKLMNEILAETAGTVTEICVDNGQVVEFGQPLMYIS